jgi:metal-dependent amidase/aminoacylase/carboxypeptidase family protein
VATVGLWRQEPNVYNAIPRRVQLDIDVRDTDDARRDAVLSTAFQAAAEIAARRKCTVTTDTVFKYPVGVCDKKVLPHTFSYPATLHVSTQLTGSEFLCRRQRSLSASLYAGAQK